METIPQTGPAAKLELNIFCPVRIVLGGGGCLHNPCLIVGVHGVSFAVSLLRNGVVLKSWNIFPLPSLRGWVIMVSCHTHILVVAGRSW